MTEGSGSPAERYARVAELFHHALDMPTEARDAWLATLRAHDAGMARDVAALIAAHDKASDFIERPAFSEIGAAVKETAATIPQGPLGHYRVLDLLGRGGMGVVYLAEDTRLERMVALKAVRPSSVDPTRIDRLRDEARAAAALSHPNIATVYALEEFDGQPYLVTEYVRGRTLRHKLAQGPLPVAEVCEIGLGMARALAAAHERGVIHHDIKPDNVVVTDAGVVKVLDFGLARVASSGPIGADARTHGTVAYMAPERLRGQPTDARADLFSLGVTLYELATGRSPFEGSTHAETTSRVLDHHPPRLTTEVPSGEAPADVVLMLDRVVMRCLEKLPSARPSSAAEIIVALERAPTAAASTPRPAPARRGGRWWWQFHQAATFAAYTILALALWRSRAVGGAALGSSLFFIALVSGAVSVMLRWHLWFALREFDDDWAREHTLTRRLIRGADVVFAAALAARGLSAIRTDDLNDPSAALFLVSGAAVAVSALIVEPATLRAMERER